MVNNKLSNVLRLSLSLLLIISGALKLYSVNAFANTIKMFSDAYFITLDSTSLYILSWCICLYELCIGVFGLFDKFRIS